MKTNHTFRLLLLSLIVLLSSNVNALTVTNLSPATYIQTPYIVGVVPYLDRSWTITVADPTLVGETLIRVNNVDRSFDTDNYITFTVDQAVVVYVAIDDRLTTVPVRYASWTKTTQTTTNSDAKSFTFYKKSFPAGNVVLGSINNGGVNNIFPIIVSDGPIVPDTENPTVPTALASSTLTQNSFTLSWAASTDNIGVTAYEVFANGTSKGTTTTTSMNITGLAANTSYAMTVKAKDAAGNISNASTTLNVQTLAPDVSPPTAPTGIIASSIYSTSLTLAWTASSDNVGVDHYEIFFNGVSKGTTSSTTKSIVGLTENTTYSVTVKAFDSAGNSTLSAAKSISTNGIVNETVRRVKQGIHITGLEDYSADKILADVMRTARSYFIDGTDVNSNNAPKDANGWPTSDFKVMVYTGLKLNNNHGTYKLYFNGKATVTLTVSGMTITNMNYNSATNESTADVVLTTSASDFYFLFKNTQRTNASATNTGVTNIKLMRPTMPGATTSFPKETIVNPQFKNAISFATTIRSMGITGTNRSAGPWDSVWNSTTIKGWNESTQSGYTLANKRVCWEAVAVIANETEKDLWINIPHKADDDYILKVLNTFKYGSDGNGNPYTSIQANPVIAPLKPHLKLYVEYSNEIWNYAGSYWAQTRYCEAKGLASPICKFDGETDQYILTYRYKALRSVQMSDLCRQVFGDSEMMTRIRPVICWQQKVNDNTSKTLLFIDRYFNKRDSRSPVAVAHPVNYYFYGGGGSAYWYPDDNANSSTIWTTGGFNPDNYHYLLRNDAAWLKSFGLEYAIYEGDHHYRTASQAVLRSVQWDNRQENEHIEHLKVLSQLGAVLVNWLQLVNIEACDWGMINQDVSNTNFPKMRACATWNAMAEHDAEFLGGTIPFSRNGNAFDISTSAEYRPETYTKTGGVTLTANTHQYAAGYCFNVSKNMKGKVQIEYSSNIASTIIIEAEGMVIGTLNLPSSSNANVAAAWVSSNFVINKIYTLRVVCTTGAATINKVTFAEDIGTDNSKVLSAEPSLEVYPNPTSDFLQIRLGGVQEAKTYIELNDISGKSILKLSRNNTQQNDIIELNTADVNEGLYVLKIINGSNTLRSKVIIKH